MPLLFDAYGRAIRSRDTSRDDVIAAIQAAAIAGEWATAQDIADRHGMKNVCLCCGIKSATTNHHGDNGRQGPWRVCITCFHDLNPEPDFTNMKSYLSGLMKRDVQ